MSILKEFKEFAVRGNALDLAVGIIIGGAFGKIVTSLVNDILMPPLGQLLAGVNFSDLFVALSRNSYPSLDAARKAGVATINYGLFVQNLINFLIVAVAVFLLVKTINMVRRRLEGEAKKEEKAAPEDVELLREIRDVLKAQR